MTDTKALVKRVRALETSLFCYLLPCPACDEGVDECRCTCLDFEPPEWADVLAVLKDVATTLDAAQERAEKLHKLLDAQREEPWVWMDEEAENHVESMGESMWVLIRGGQLRPLLKRAEKAERERDELREASGALMQWLNESPSGCAICEVIDGDHEPDMPCSTLCDALHARTDGEDDAP